MPEGKGYPATTESDKTKSTVVKPVGSGGSNSGRKTTSASVVQQV